MDLITIESKVFREIIDKLNKIETRFIELEGKTDYPLNERWLDNQEVTQLLNISKRTLQFYRDDALISFSQIGNKMYYKVVDVENFLKRHYYKTPADNKIK